MAEGENVADPEEAIEARIAKLESLRFDCGRMFSGSPRHVRALEKIAMGWRRIALQLKQETTDGQTQQG